MKTPIIDLLQEFSYNLSGLTSTGQVDELEIILPIEQFKQFEYEIHDRYMSYGPSETKYNLRTVGGINFKISCKELNDQLILKKLNECFEILKK